MRAGRALVALLLALAGACGDDAGEAAIPFDASPDGRCAPQALNHWKPTWRPPETPRMACTAEQIDREFALCESSTGNAAECTAFNRDRANAACLQCLYSTEDENTYGPVVYLKNRSRVVNIPGCIALIDGDLSATGCAAQLQASESCGYAACMGTCAVYEDFRACSSTAANAVCATHRVGISCGDPSMYDACLDFNTFEEYYRSFAHRFCQSLPDAGTPDAGPSDAGRADAANDATDAKNDGAEAGRGVRFRFPEHVVNESPAGRGIEDALLR